MLTDSAVENGWVRARKDRLKAHAVSRRQSEVFTALLSHTLSNWHGTDAPRLQHTTTTDNVTIQLLTDAILVNKQTNARMHAHTHTHTQPVNGLCLGLPKGTFSDSHQSWSSNIFYQLPPSTMIHSILLVQLTCLTVIFHNLSPRPLWSTSWSGTLYFILHTFLHPVIIGQYIWKIIRKIQLNNK